MEPAAPAAAPWSDSPAPESVVDAEAEETGGADDAPPTAVGGDDEQGSPAPQARAAEDVDASPSTDVASESPSSTAVEGPIEPNAVDADAVPAEIPPPTAEPVVDDTAAPVAEAAVVDQPVVAVDAVTEQAGAVDTGEWWWGCWYTVDAGSFNVIASRLTIEASVLVILWVFVVAAVVVGCCCSTDIDPISAQYLPISILDSSLSRVSSSLHTPTPTPQ